MRAHSSLRLGTLRGTTPELLASPWYCAWGFCMVWEAGLPHKTSSPLTQRRNGRACSSLTARGGGLPVGVIGLLELLRVLPSQNTHNHDFIRINPVINRMTSVYTAAVSGADMVNSLPKPGVFGQFLTSFYQPVII